MLGLALIILPSSNKPGDVNFFPGAREPWVHGGQMTPRNLPGGVKRSILTPIIFWKEVFSGTHPHVVFEATS